MPAVVERPFSGAVLAAALIAASTLVLAVVLPQAPVEFVNAWGFAPEGTVYTALPLDNLAAVGDGAFSTVLRVCLGTAWASWVALLFLLRFAGRTERAVVLAIVAATVGLVVVSFPPVLSSDVLGYVAYGRVAGLLGLNPYVHGRDALAAAGDPTSAFLVWDTPLPYGPLWIMVASAISVAGDRLGGVWVEVLLHKIVAAVALIVGGIAAVSLRERRPSSWLPIIVLNPLLLLEGPGAGHNDIVMTALLVASARLIAARLLVGGALVLGCAVAVKPVAFAALPLVAWSLWRSGERPKRVTGIIGLSAIPTAGLSLGFGGPALLVSNVMRRAGSGPPQIDAALTIGLVAVVTAAVILHRSPNVASRWLAAWVPLALGIAVSVMPLAFPWYITWAMLPALALTGREAPVAIAASVVIGLQLTWRYAVAT